MCKKLFFITITLLLLARCDKKPQIIDTELIEVKVSEKLQCNETALWLKPYKATLDEAMNIKIGMSAMEMEAGVPESSLGSFVTTVMADYADRHGKYYDCIITNIGGLRNNLPKGEITIGTVYEMFPFDNELVILTISGTKLAELCQIIAKQGGQVTSGISMIISNGNGESVKVAGKPIDTLKNYKILTTDYLSFGNDGLLPLAEHIKFYSFKTPLREIIIEYIRNEFKKGRMIKAEERKEVVAAEFK